MCWKCRNKRRATEAEAEARLIEFARKADALSSRAAAARETLVSRNQRNHWSEAIDSIINNGSTK